MPGGSIIRKDEKIGLKQLFDDESSTYTYLLWDQNSNDAILVDPVDIQVDRDIKEAQNLDLNLVYGGTFFLHAACFLLLNHQLRHSKMK